MARSRVPYNTGALMIPDQSILWQYMDAEAANKVSFGEKEFASKNTSSLKVGTQLPPIPPLLVAQWLTSSQLPVPPTQYRFCAADPLMVIPFTFPPSTLL